jgi:hypothetical protein
MVLVNRIDEGECGALFWRDRRREFLEDETRWPRRIHLCQGTERFGTERRTARAPHVVRQERSTTGVDDVVS